MIGNAESEATGTITGKKIHQTILSTASSTPGIRGRPVDGRRAGTSAIATPPSVSMKYRSATDTRSTRASRLRLTRRAVPTHRRPARLRENRLAKMTVEFVEGGVEVVRDRDGGGEGLRTGRNPDGAAAPGGADEPSGMI